MSSLTRRMLLGLASSALASSAGRGASPSDEARSFIAEAHRMREQAIAAGDQPFGAVIVSDGLIIGHGPSRVVLDRNPEAHAERVAIADAQRRLASKDLAGATMYSTSRPCSACENAAALANIGRMFFGPLATDAGKPRRL